MWLLPMVEDRSSAGIKMGRCLCPIEGIPNYTPQLVAFGIALIEFIIVVIAYIIHEVQLKKTFYGKEDVEDIPEEEKMEHEGVIMGNNAEEMKIVQAKDLSEEPKSLRTPSAAGVKVMMRRKKARSIVAESPLTNAVNLRFTLDIDKTMRGFEFINLLEAAVKEVDEFKDIREKLSEDAEDRLTDFLVGKLRTILEQSTQNKWIVHGVIQGRFWRINGLENLLEQGDIKMNQMLKITVQGPTSPIVLLSYMTEVEIIKPQLSTRAISYSPGMFSKRRMLTESITQTLTQTPKKPFESRMDPKPLSTKGDVATQSLFRNPYMSMHTVSTARSDATNESKKRKRPSTSAKISKRSSKVATETTKLSGKVFGKRGQVSFTGTPMTTQRLSGAYQTPVSATAAAQSATSKTQTSQTNQTESARKFKTRAKPPGESRILPIISPSGSDDSDTTQRSG